MKPKQIKQLEEMATNMVGDGGSPDLFFVTDQGVVVTVTRDFNVAYSHWCRLAHNCRTRYESALENRRIGVICDVSPDSDEPNARLIVRDDTYMWKKELKLA